MENRFEHNEPEEHTWKKYLPPNNSPLNAPETNQQQQQQKVSQDALCAWVCEQLSYLLDNDGSVRPEQAAGIHGHLALCRHCAQEWEDMQNVVGLVESLPPVELPRDFSGLIMQRIELQNAPLVPHTLTPQPIAENYALAQAVTTARTKVTPAQATEQKTLTQTAQQTLSTTQTQQSRSQLVQRMSAGSALSGILAYFLSTAWGRQMLGANVTTASAWLGQAADVLRSVPVVTWIFGLIFSALAQVNTMLNSTYHAMGTAAAVGFGMDVAICAFAYMYLSARRRNAQMQL